MFIVHGHTSGEMGPPVAVHITQNVLAIACCAADGFLCAAGNVRYCAWQYDIDDSAPLIAIIPSVNRKNAHSC